MKLTDEHDLSKSGRRLASLLEKLVDGRFLILLLSFLFYLDIWLLQVEVNPTKLTLHSGYESVKNISVFTAILFVLSYSLLMVGFFPTLRKIIGIGQLYLRSNIIYSNRSAEEQHLSDWSIAFIVLSAYDAAIGYFKSASGYKGLSIFALDFLQSNDLVTVIFRLCAAFLWLVCLSLSFEVDNPS